MNKYSLSDISVIIATYNRAHDLEITIKSLYKDIKKIKEVIIIDQSNNQKTKGLIKKHKGIKYIYSEVPSLTLARNVGIKNVSKDSRLVIFLDDDVTLEKNYFENILEVFNKYPEAMGVSGHYFPRDKKINKLENFIRKLCLLENWTVNSAKVLSVFGASYPYKLTKLINSSWISGFNMAYKKEVFEYCLFDENFFRYALAEDFEFSTRIHKKYPKGLYVTPYAGITHRVSEAERMPKPKLIYMNLVNHIYIQNKNFNNFIGVIFMGWALTTMSTLQAVNYLINPTKTNKIRIKTYFKALYYCLKRLSKIRKGMLDVPARL